MELLSLEQVLLVSIVFIWSGFVRSGLGFGGAVLSLPFLLLIDDRPQVYLPIISVHLLIFGSWTVWQGHRYSQKSIAPEATIDWKFLRYSMSIMIIPKLFGVFGLITLPNDVLNGIIFSIVFLYSLSYIFNRPLKSNNRYADVLFLVLGGYISGTSLIGAPLIVSVYASHVKKEQLRDTLFVLWVILVTIKMTAFIWAGIDLQLQEALYLLPVVGLGHYIGLKLHKYLLTTNSTVFFRVIGFALLGICCVGFYQLTQGN